MFNHKVENNEQIVARRSVNKSDSREYMDRPSCLARLSLFTLRRHYRYCTGVVTNANKRNTHQKSKKITFDLHPHADHIVRNHIFPVFENDYCIKLIRKDFLAILYGNKMVEKYRSPHHYKMIRANLRYIGKFLCQIKEKSINISDFASCFNAMHYDSCVECINIVAKFDEDKEAPYTAFALGNI